MDIPVFHDDQHGTAIIAAAGLINALRPHRPRHEDDEARRATAPARPASPASNSSRRWASRPSNVILCDTKGVVYQGRTEGMNQWKSAHAVETDARTLAEAMDGADVVFGLSAKGAFTHDDDPVDGQEPDHLRHGQSRSGDHAGGGRRDPRPTPSWRPAARTIRTRSTTCWASPTSSAARSTCAPPPSTMEMKIAAAQALAELAREDVPDEVAAAYQGTRPRFGPRLHHPGAVRSAPDLGDPAGRGQGRDGDGRRAPADRRHRPPTRSELSARRDPIAGDAAAHLRARAPPARSASSSPRARRSRSSAPPSSYRQPGARHGHPGRPRGASSRRTRAAAGIDLDRPGIEIHNARLSRRNAVYADYLYERLQRKGFLFRDCQRLINHDRNHFAACMVALGDADAMVTGVTRNYSTALDDVRRVIDAKPGHRVIGVSLVLCARPHRARRRHGRARHAERGGARRHRRRGGRRRAPPGLRAARRLLAYSTFGHPQGERSRARAGGGEDPRQARASTSSMTARWRPTSRSTATLMAHYPFCRLTGPANVLVMPAFHSASISTKMLQELGGSHGDRPAAGRPRTSRCRSSRSAPRIPTSSTWRRSRRITPGLEGRVRAKPGATSPSPLVGEGVALDHERSER